MRHRVLVRIEAAPHLTPRQRHGDRCALACARRKRRDGGGHPIVAQVIEEDATGTRLLRHRRRGSDPVTSSAICVHTACANAFAVGQSTLPLRGCESSVTTCRPLPPVVLAEGDEADLLESFAQLEGGLDHSIEGHVRCRIEIEQRGGLGSSGMIGNAVPRMQLESGDLAHACASASTRSI